MDNDNLFKHRILDESYLNLPKYLPKIIIIEVRGRCYLYFYEAGWIDSSNDKVFCEAYEKNIVHDTHPIAD